MTTGYKLLGYKLADNIFYCPHHPGNYRVTWDANGRFSCAASMACLLEYLLAHGRERLVSDEELMINVWEKIISVRPRSDMMAGYPDPKISLKTQAGPKAR